MHKPLCNRSEMVIICRNTSSTLKDATKPQSFPTDTRPLAVPSFHLIESPSFVLERSCLPQLPQSFCFP